MRLCNIKLSGFKSFVDHTNLIVPGNLVGIVGPNGCGKSNIIDAVTWVMGESSAKHLRGESLTDVIFSGSSARQPVGQASVELVFDNTEKKLGGQYASYNEISVKRQINRDGISTYFLNGTRCRRRDITAIFLGTGLGPRSYAIIEQGMISRLIEAKPEELRVYIEEAAGISKYRERRRETENRIKHTKENLDRLNDIREELEKQLNHLQRQAKAAERYKELKQEERQINAELLALQWREMNSEMANLKDKAVEKENAVEAGVAKVRQIEAEIEKQREALSEANNGFNDRQSEYYQIGSDIAQYEQKLQHIKEKISNVESELEKTKQSLSESEKQHAQDRQEYDSLLNELQQLEPKLQGSRNESNQAYEILNRAEEAMQSWQTEWETFNESFTDFSRRQQADQSRLEYLQNRIEEQKERQHLLQKEIDVCEQDPFADDIAKSVKQLESLESNQLDANSVYQNAQSLVKEKRELIKETSVQLDQARNREQILSGQLSSLETLQRSIMSGNEELDGWLTKNGLSEFKRLSQSLKIDKEWAHALETVTGSMLGYICVDNLETFQTDLDSVPGKLGLIDIKSNESIKDTKQDWTTLQDLISGDANLPLLLNNIVIANSTDEAKSLLTSLPEGYSAITKEGVWMSRNWLIVNHSEQAEDSVLSREQEIERVKIELESAKQQREQLEQASAIAEKTLETAEQELEKNQTGLTSSQQQVSDIKTQLAGLEAKQAENKKRLEESLEEFDRLNVELRNDEQEVVSIASRLNELDKDKDKLESQREELSSVREAHKNKLNEARQRWQNTHEESHGIALQLESYSSRRASYEQAIKRNEIQIQHFTSRLKELHSELEQSSAPMSELQQQIENALKTKLEAEKKLSEARSHVQGIEEHLRKLEQGRQENEQKLEGLRSALEKARIDVNGCQVRLETVIEKLNDFEQSAETLLQQLEDTAKPAEWQEKLDAIGRKIQRLGAINLAAIDEYAQSAERKTYLDSQHKDLTEALETLESAIRKIDKETRTRFKETFDELNTNIKEMFPQLFGGGHAYLELTGDDLLQTGVAIMARPPGKKNSNIHLLSGGEKALTAVALVFAIFKLNPAPFCILDEVDAPLDDTNVSRFSNLVKSMSDEVQFIFITHNKITMEIANQLMGVTMHEAGVSRLVSVDVDEAVEMAATA